MNTKLLFGDCIKLNFCDFLKVTKKIRMLEIFILQTNSPTKTAKNVQIGAQVLTKNTTQNVRHYRLKIQHLFQTCWCIESAATGNLKRDEFTREKNWKILLTNGKSNKHPMLWNIAFHFRYWFNLLMMKKLRMNKFVVLIYQYKVKFYLQIWNLKSYLFKFVILTLKFYVHR